MNIEIKTTGVSYLVYLNNQNACRKDDGAAVNWTDCDAVMDDTINNNTVGIRVSGGSSNPSIEMRVNGMTVNPADVLCYRNGAGHSFGQAVMTLPYDDTNGEWKTPVVVSGNSFWATDKPGGGMITCRWKGLWTDQSKDEWAAAQGPTSEMVAALREELQAIRVVNSGINEDNSVLAGKISARYLELNNELASLNQYADDLNFELGNLNTSIE